MKLLKYKASNFTTDSAHQLCLDLEASLGVNLMNHDPNNPNEVHGYFNTNSDGDIEVCLYEQEDIEAINAIPVSLTEEIEIERDGKKVKERRTHARRAINVPLVRCALPDAVVVAKCDHEFITKKGWKKHPDMGGKSIKRGDHYGREKA